MDSARPHKGNEGIKNYGNNFNGQNSSLTPVKMILPIAGKNRIEDVIGSTECFDGAAFDKEVTDRCTGNGERDFSLLPAGGGRLDGQHASDTGMDCTPFLPMIRLEDHVSLQRNSASSSQCFSPPTNGGASQNNVPSKDPWINTTPSQNDVEIENGINSGILEQPYDISNPHNDGRNVQQTVVRRTEKHTIMRRCDSCSCEENVGKTLPTQVLDNPPPVSSSYSSSSFTKSLMNHSDSASSVDLGCLPFSTSERELDAGGDRKSISHSEIALTSSGQPAGKSSFPSTPLSQSPQTQPSGAALFFFPSTSTPTVIPASCPHFSVERSVSQRRGVERITSSSLPPFFGQRIFSNEACPDVSPVVHIRVRPLLPSLKEHIAERRVWVLDQENILVKVGDWADRRKGGRRAGGVMTSISRAADDEETRGNDDHSVVSPGRAYKKSGKVHFTLLSSDQSNKMNPTDFSSSRSSTKRGSVAPVWTTRSTGPRASPSLRLETAGKAAKGGGGRGAAKYTTPMTGDLHVKGNSTTLPSKAKAHVGDSLFTRLPDREFSCSLMSVADEEEKSSRGRLRKGETPAGNVPASRDTRKIPHAFSFPSSSVSSCLVHGGPPIGDNPTPAVGSTSSPCGCTEDGTSSLIFSEDLAVSSLHEATEVDRGVVPQETVLASSERKLKRGERSSPSIGADYQQFFSPRRMLVEEPLMTSSSIPHSFSTQLSSHIEEERLFSEKDKSAITLTDHVNEGSDITTTPTTITARREKGGSKGRKGYPLLPLEKTKRSPYSPKSVRRISTCSTAEESPHRHSSNGPPLDSVENQYLERNCSLESDKDDFMPPLTSPVGTPRALPFGTLSSSPGNSAKGRSLHDFQLAPKSSVVQAKTKKSSITDTPNKNVDNQSIRGNSPNKSIMKQQQHQRLGGNQVDSESRSASLMGSILHGTSHDGPTIVLSSLCGGGEPIHFPDAGEIAMHGGDAALGSHSEMNLGLSHLSLLSSSLPSSVARMRRGFHSASLTHDSLAALSGLGKERDSAWMAGEQHFTFDLIHDEDTVQEEVFIESIMNMLDMGLSGKNIAILCYGPTGSGKTFTMMGNVPALLSRKKIKKPSFPISLKAEERTNPVRYATKNPRDKNDAHDLFPASVSAREQTSAGIGGCSIPRGNRRQGMSILRATPPLDKRMSISGSLSSSCSSFGGGQQEEQKDYERSGKVGGCAPKEVGGRMKADRNAVHSHFLSFKREHHQEEDFSMTSVLDAKDVGILPRLVEVLLERIHGNENFSKKTSKEGIAVSELIPKVSSQGSLSDGKPASLSVGVDSRSTSPESFKSTQTRFSVPTSTSVPSVTLPSPSKRVASFSRRENGPTCDDPNPGKPSFPLSEKKRELEGGIDGRKGGENYPSSFAVINSHCPDDSATTAEAVRSRTYPHYQHLLPSSSLCGVSVSTAGCPSFPRHTTPCLRGLRFYGIELYNDAILDLLDPKKRPVKYWNETSGLSGICEVLDRKPVESGSFGGGGMDIFTMDDLDRAFQRAMRNRVTLSHALNDTSSRSHAVFIIQLQFELTRGGPSLQPSFLASRGPILSSVGRECVAEEDLLSTTNIPSPPPTTSASLRFSSKDQDSKGTSSKKGCTQSASDAPYVADEEALPASFEAIPDTLTDILQSITQNSNCDAHLPSSATSTNPYINNRKSLKIELETIAKMRHSYIALVDLAGCERVKETNVQGTALKEAQYINKSLSALSSVMLALYQRSPHVPYRDSKLTRLLRPCLQEGRVMTLVHVAPCSGMDSLTTLKFADQIRHTQIRTHDFRDARPELQDQFEKLIDPSLRALERNVQDLKGVMSILCAEVRLSHLSRSVVMSTVPTVSSSFNGSFSSPPLSSRIQSTASKTADGEVARDCGIWARSEKEGKALQPPHPPLSATSGTRNAFRVSTPEEGEGSEKSPSTSEGASRNTSSDRNEHLSSCSAPNLSFLPSGITHITPTTCLPSLPPLPSEGGGRGKEVLSGTPSPCLPFSCLSHDAAMSPGNYDGVAVPMNNHVSLHPEDSSERVVEASHSGTLFPFPSTASGVNRIRACVKDCIQKFNESNEAHFAEAVHGIEKEKRQLVERGYRALQRQVKHLYAMMEEMDQYNQRLLAEKALPVLRDPYLQELNREITDTCEYVSQLNQEHSECMSLRALLKKRMTGLAALERAIDTELEAVQNPFPISYEPPTGFPFLLTSSVSSSVSSPLSLSPTPRGNATELPPQLSRELITRKELEKNQLTKIRKGKDTNAHKSSSFAFDEHTTTSSSSPSSSHQMEEETSYHTLPLISLPGEFSPLSPCEPSINSETRSSSTGSHPSSENSHRPIFSCHISAQSTTSTSTPLPASTTKASSSTTNAITEHMNPKPDNLTPIPLTCIPISCLTSSSDAAAKPFSLPSSHGVISLSLTSSSPLSSALSHCPSPLLCKAFPKNASQDSSTCTSGLPPSPSENTMALSSSLATTATSAASSRNDHAHPTPTPSVQAQQSEQGPVLTLPRLSPQHLNSSLVHANNRTANALHSTSNPLIFLGRGGGGGGSSIITTAPSAVPTMTSGTTTVTNSSNRSISSTSHSGDSRTNHRVLVEVDRELRAICFQQVVLCQTMSALRMEVQSFATGESLWEGLWAQAMRKEILMVMWVERLLMETILLKEGSLAAENGMLAVDDEENDASRDWGQGGQKGYRERILPHKGDEERRVVLLRCQRIREYMRKYRGVSPCMNHRGATPLLWHSHSLPIVTTLFSPGSPSSFSQEDTSHSFRTTCSSTNSSWSSEKEKSSECLKKRDRGHQPSSGSSLSSLPSTTSMLSSCNSSRNLSDDTYFSSLPSSVAAPPSPDLPNSLPSSYATKLFFSDYKEEVEMREKEARRNHYNNDNNGDNENSDSQIFIRGRWRRRQSLQEALTAREIDVRVLGVGEKMSWPLLSKWNGVREGEEENNVMRKERDPTQRDTSGASDTVTPTENTEINKEKVKDIHHHLRHHYTTTATRTTRNSRTELTSREGNAPHSTTKDRCDERWMQEGNKDVRQRTKTSAKTCTSRNVLTHASEAKKGLKQRESHGVLEPCGQERRRRGKRMTRTTTTCLPSGETASSASSFSNGWSMRRGSASSPPPGCQDKNHSSLLYPSTRRSWVIPTMGSAGVVPNPLDDLYWMALHRKQEEKRRKKWRKQYQQEEEEGSHASAHKVERKVKTAEYLLHEKEAEEEKKWRRTEKRVAPMSSRFSNVLQLGEHGSTKGRFMEMNNVSTPSHDILEEFEEPPWVRANNVLSSAKCLEGTTLRRRTSSTSTSTSSSSSASPSSITSHSSHTFHSISDELYDGTYFSSSKDSFSSSPPQQDLPTSLNSSYLSCSFPSSSLLHTTTPKIAMEMEKIRQNEIHEQNSEDENFEKCGRGKRKTHYQTGEDQNMDRGEGPECIIKENGESETLLPSPRKSEHDVVSPSSLRIDHLEDIAYRLCPSPFPLSLEKVPPASEMTMSQLLYSPHHDSMRPHASRRMLSPSGEGAEGNMEEEHIRSLVDLSAMEDRKATFQPLMTFPLLTDIPSPSYSPMGGCVLPSKKIKKDKEGNGGDGNEEDDGSSEGFEIADDDGNADFFRSSCGVNGGGVHPLDSTFTRQPRPHPPLFSSFLLLRKDGEGKEEEDEKSQDYFPSMYNVSMSTSLIPSLSSQAIVATSPASNAHSPRSLPSQHLASRFGLSGSLQTEDNTNETDRHPQSTECSDGQSSAFSPSSSNSFVKGSWVEGEGMGKNSPRHRRSDPRNFHLTASSKTPLSFDQICCEKPKEEMEGKEGQHTVDATSSAVLPSLSPFLSMPPRGVFTSGIGSSLSSRRGQHAKGRGSAANMSSGCSGLSSRSSIGSHQASDGTTGFTALMTATNITLNNNRNAYDKFSEGHAVGMLSGQEVGGEEESPPKELRGQGEEDGSLGEICSVVVSAVGESLFIPAGAASFCASSPQDSCSSVVMEGSDVEKVDDEEGGGEKGRKYLSGKGTPVTPSSIPESRGGNGVVTVGKKEEEVQFSPNVAPFKDSDDSSHHRGECNDPRDDEDMKMRMKLASNMLVGGRDKSNTTAASEKLEHSLLALFPSKREEIVRFETLNSLSIRNGSTQEKAEVEGGTVDNHKSKEWFENECKERSCEQRSMSISSSSASFTCSYNRREKAQRKNDSCAPPRCQNYHNMADGDDNRHSLSPHLHDKHQTLKPQGGEDEFSSESSSSPFSSSASGTSFSVMSNNSSPAVLINRQQIKKNDSEDMKCPLLHTDSSSCFFSSSQGEKLDNSIITRKRKVREKKNEEDIQEEKKSREDNVSLLSSTCASAVAMHRSLYPYISLFGSYSAEPSFQLQSLLRLRYEGIVCKVYCIPLDFDNIFHKYLSPEETSNNNCRNGGKGGSFWGEVADFSFCTMTTTPPSCYYHHHHPTNHGARSTPHVPIPKHQSCFAYWGRLCLTYHPPSWINAMSTTSSTSATSFSSSSPPLSSDLLRQHLRQTHHRAHTKQPPPPLHQQIGGYTLDFFCGTDGRIPPPPSLFLSPFCYRKTQLDKSKKKTEGTMAAITRMMMVTIGRQKMTKSFQRKGEKMGKKRKVSLPFSPPMIFPHSLSIHHSKVLYLQEVRQWRRRRRRRRISHSSHPTPPSLEHCSCTSPWDIGMRKGTNAMHSSGTADAEKESEERSIEVEQTAAMENSDADTEEGEEDSWMDGEEEREEEEGDKSSTSYHLPDKKEGEEEEEWAWKDHNVNGETPAWKRMNTSSSSFYSSSVQHERAGEGWSSLAQTAGDVTHGVSPTARTARRDRKHEYNDSSTHSNVHHAHHHKRGKIAAREGNTRVDNCGITDEYKSVSLKCARRGTHSATTAYGRRYWTTPSFLKWKERREDRKSEDHCLQRGWRLFSIPLTEPSLLLHLHVLEKGIASAFPIACNEEWSAGEERENGVCKEEAEVAGRAIDIDEVEKIGEEAEVAGRAIDIDEVEKMGEEAEVAGRQMRTRSKNSPTSSTSSSNRTKGTPFSTHREERGGQEEEPKVGTALVTAQEKIFTSEAASFTPHLPLFPSPPSSVGERKSLRKGSIGTDVLRKDGKIAPRALRPTGKNENSSTTSTQKLKKKEGRTSTHAVYSAAGRRGAKSGAKGVKDSVLLKKSKKAEKSVAPGSLATITAAAVVPRIARKKVKKAAAPMAVAMAKDAPPPRCSLPFSSLSMIRPDTERVTAIRRDKRRWVPPLTVAQEQQQPQEDEETKKERDEHKKENPGAEPKEEAKGNEDQDKFSNRRIMVGGVVEDPPDQEKEMKEAKKKSEERGVDDEQENIQVEQIKPQEKEEEDCLHCRPFSGPLVALMLSGFPLDNVQLQPQEERQEGGEGIRRRREEDGGRADLLFPHTVNSAMHSFGGRVREKEFRIHSNNEGWTIRRTRRPKKSRKGETMLEKNFSGDLRRKESNEGKWTRMMVGAEEGEKEKLGNEEQYNNKEKESLRSSIKNMCIAAEKTIPTTSSTCTSITGSSSCSSQATIPSSLLFTSTSDTVLSRRLEFGATLSLPSSCVLPLLHATEGSNGEKPKKSPDALPSNISSSSSSGSASRAGEGIATSNEADLDNNKNRTSSVPRPPPPPPPSSPTGGTSHTGTSATTTVISSRRNPPSPSCTFLFTFPSPVVDDASAVSHMEAIVSALSGLLISRESTEEGAPLCSSHSGGGHHKEMWGRWNHHHHGLSTSSHNSSIGSQSSRSNTSNRDGQGPAGTFPSTVQKMDMTTLGEHSSSPYSHTLSSSTLRPTTSSIPPSISGAASPPLSHRFYFSSAENPSGLPSLPRLLLPSYSTCANYSPFLPENRATLWNGTVSYSSVPFLLLMMWAGYKRAEAMEKKEKEWEHGEKNRELKKGNFLPYHRCHDDTDREGMDPRQTGSETDKEKKANKDGGEERTRGGEAHQRHTFAHQDQKGRGSGDEHAEGETTGFQDGDSPRFLSASLATNSFSCPLRGNSILHFPISIPSGALSSEIAASDRPYDSVSRQPPTPEGSIGKEETQKMPNTQPGEVAKGTQVAPVVTTETYDDENTHCLHEKERRGEGSFTSLVSSLRSSHIHSCLEHDRHGGRLHGMVREDPFWSTRLTDEKEEGSKNVRDLENGRGSDECEREDDDDDEGSERHSKGPLAKFAPPSSCLLAQQETNIYSLTSDPPAEKNKVEVHPKRKSRPRFSPHASLLSAAAPPRPLTLSSGGEEEKVHASQEDVPQGSCSTAVIFPMSPSSKSSSTFSSSSCSQSSARFPCICTSCPNSPADSSSLPINKTVQKDHANKMDEKRKGGRGLFHKRDPSQEVGEEEQHTHAEAEVKHVNKADRGNRFPALPFIEASHEEVKNGTDEQLAFLSLPSFSSSSAAAAPAPPRPAAAPLMSISSRLVQKERKKGRRDNPDWDDRCGPLPRDEMVSHGVRQWWEDSQGITLEELPSTWGSCLEVTMHFPGVMPSSAVPLLTRDVVPGRFPAFSSSSLTPISLSHSVERREGSSFSPFNPNTEGHGGPPSSPLTSSFQFVNQYGIEMEKKQIRAAAAALRSLQKVEVSALGSVKHERTSLISKSGVPPISSFYSSYHICSADASTRVRSVESQWFPYCPSIREKWFKKEREVTKESYPVEGCSSTTRGNIVSRGTGGHGAHHCAREIHQERIRQRKAGRSTRAGSRRRKEEEGTSLLVSASPMAAMVIDTLKDHFYLSSFGSPVPHSLSSPFPMTSFPNFISQKDVEVPLINLLNRNSGRTGTTSRSTSSSGASGGALSAFRSIPHGEAIDVRGWGNRDHSSFLRPPRRPTSPLDKTALVAFSEAVKRSACIATGVVHRQTGLFSSCLPNALGQGCCSGHSCSLPPFLSLPSFLPPHSWRMDTPHSNYMDIFRGAESRTFHRHGDDNDEEEEEDKDEAVRKKKPVMPAGNVLAQMRWLRVFRSNIREVIKQQLYDAEDIRNELPPALLWSQEHQQRAPPDLSKKGTAGHQGGSERSSFHACSGCISRSRSEGANHFRTFSGVSSASSANCSHLHIPSSPSSATAPLLSASSSSAWYSLCSTPSAWAAERRTSISNLRQQQQLREQQWSQEGNSQNGWVDAKERWSGRESVEKDEESSFSAGNEEEDSETESRGEATRGGGYDEDYSSHQGLVFTYHEEIERDAVTYVGVTLPGYHPRPPVSSDHPTHPQQLMNFSFPPDTRFSQEERNRHRESFSSCEAKKMNRSGVQTCAMAEVNLTDCRELFGHVVPWTIWHWAYRWPILQQYQHKQNHHSKVEKEAGGGGGGRGGDGVLGLPVCNAPPGGNRDESFTSHRSLSFPSTFHSSGKLGSIKGAPGVPTAEGGDLAASLCVNEWEPTEAESEKNDGLVADEKGRRGKHCYNIDVSTTSSTIDVFDDNANQSRACERGSIPFSSSSALFASDKPSPRFPLDGHDKDHGYRSPESSWSGSFSGNATSSEFDDDDYDDAVNRFGSAASWFEESLVQASHYSSQPHTSKTVHLPQLRYGAVPAYLGGIRSP